MTPKKEKKKEKQKDKKYLILPNDPTDEEIEAFINSLLGEANQEDSEEETEDEKKP